MKKKILVYVLPAVITLLLTFFCGWQWTKDQIYKGDEITIKSFGDRNLTIESEENVRINSESYNGFYLEGEEKIINSTPFYSENANIKFRLEETIKEGIWITNYQSDFINIKITGENATITSICKHQDLNWFITILVGFFVYLFLIFVAEIIFDTIKERRKIKSVNS